MGILRFVPVVGTIVLNQVDHKIAKTVAGPLAQRVEQGIVNGLDAQGVRAEVSVTAEGTWGTAIRGFKSHDIGIVDLQISIRLEDYWDVVRRHSEVAAGVLVVPLVG